ncbi:ATP-binding cassette domain-containing protein [Labrenzia sp. OB1]|uniref:amino acid ABC transporter ATP-binding/permease protein n=1 Tax=Labrenzia sp. OB1 TaxID=1561204 RepID=UPI0007B2C7FC|nr:ATP-binding cassette domain-containing protein [Labrenzia sp. OB1]KZM50258.1 cysteine ABC transporter ATP-binding protein [Labrenzia sp. OB1]
MKAVWQIVSSQYRHDRFHFWIGILTAILPAVAGILLLGVSGWFITAAALAGLSGAFLNIFAPSALIRALAIIRTAGRYGERVVTHDATFRFLTALRNQLFAAFVASRDRHRRSAVLLNRLTLDITALDTVYLRIVVPVLLCVFTAAGLLCVWLVISPPVFLTGAVFLCAWAGLAWVSVARADGKVARRADAASDAIRLRAADLVAGRRDLAIYGGLDAAAAPILSADNRLTVAEDVEERRATRLICLSGLVGQTFLAVSLAVAIVGVAQAAFSPALAVGLVLVVVALPELFSMALPGLARLPRTALAAKRVSALQSVPAAQPCGAQPPAVWRPGDTPPVLGFEAVTFRYPGAARNVLETLSFDIGKAEVVAIAGRSGCGKSTVAAIASRMLEPRTGHVFLAGQDLHAYEEEALRRSITVLGQRAYLFNDTVTANLRIANAEATEADLWAALEHAALADRIAESPLGLGTVLGEGGLGLSGGEQRRLALARAFLTRPQLFILDEMTEGLDSETSCDVLSRFLKFRGSASVLMIAHKRLELEAAGRVLHLPEPGQEGR